MKQRSVGPGFICVTAWLSLYGCAGVSRVATLPPDAGVLASYHAPIDEVVNIVPQALAAHGQTEVERSRPDSSSIVLLGRRGLNFWTWGEVSRTLVTIRNAGGSQVRVVTRPRDLFNLWPSTSHSLRVISEIDRLLGPGEIALAAGDLVRGVDAGGVPTEGTLIAGELGGLVRTRGNGESERLPLDSLTQLEVLRGSYGHSRTGASIGLAVGSVIWIAALASCFDLSGLRSNCSTSAISWAPVIGGVVGGLLGGAIRTSVWSRAGLR